MSQLSSGTSSEQRPARDPLATNHWMVVLAVLGAVPVFGMYIGWVASMMAARSLVDGRGRKLLATLAGGALAVTTVVGMAIAMGPVVTVPPASRCWINLLDIRDALQAYQDEHGQVAPDLQTLVTAGLLDEHQLTCPFKHPKGARSGYFYMPAPSAPPEPVILACDMRPHGRSDTRSILTSDRSVRLVSEQEFQSLTQLPHNATFAAAFRAAGGRPKATARSGSGG